MVKKTKNRIELLCPSKHCPRCKKMIKYLNNLISQNQWDAELMVITNLKDLLRFNTWILPSIFVNGEKVARGYKPAAEKLRGKIKF